MSCNQAAQVHAYHDRQLGPAAREAFKAHLDECPACAALLGELRAISRVVADAPLPIVSVKSNERLYAAWDISRQRGLLRISGWLTGAAAAVLVGGLLLLPRGHTSNDVAAGSSQPQPQQPGAWEVAAMMPPPERTGERPDEYVELAQWIANDLSDGSGTAR